MEKLNKRARWIIAGASISLILCYFFPIWVIYLFAPQYPEGLAMNIWLNRITGDVEIINGLNHYIGMKHIHADMFPEFSFLVYIVAFYILLGLIVAWNGSTIWLICYLVFTAFGGVYALFDFYRWGYEYGHNLDPNAAIKVPGLTYQPPVLGHKRLLNFDAYSYPDIAGWIVIAAASIMTVIWLSTYHKLGKKLFLVQKAIIPLVVVLGLTSCTVEPEPLVAGQDTCYACKMGIMDTKYGAEIISKKGKIYKFDDIGCLIYHMRTENIKEQDCQRILVADFVTRKEWIDVDKAIFVQGEMFHSPMNFNFAAFVNQSKLDSVYSQADRKVFNWKQINEVVQ
ncbi:MAG: nitrous oxide reductase accessory protein NosL [Saprospiraceae bacterium]|nr:nitrous oxide reductase accessory protein NosL [Saprospiraceae bacterium]